MTCQKEAIKKKNSMTSIISASKGMCDHESGLDSYWELCTFITKVVLNTGEASKSPP